MTWSSFLRKEVVYILINVKQFITLDGMRLLPFQEMMQGGADGFILFNINVYFKTGA